MPVILWTDALVFVLVAAIGAYVLYARRQPHLRRPWGRVRQSAAGMSALVVLAVFVAIGLADSLHYRPALERQGGRGGIAYSTAVLSLFDALAAPLWSHRERTYSAPFATRAFARETLEVPGPDGKPREVREFPRLAWGGAHLKDESDRDRDVALRALAGMAGAALVWAALAGAVARRTSWRAIWSGGTPFPWAAVLVTAGGLLALAGPILALCAHYHVLGTDKVGRDVFYLALKSVRTALVIGTVTTLMMLPFALALGIMAGYFRGWIDDAIQYVYTVINSIPGVLLIAAFILIAQVFIDQNAGLFPTAAQRADVRLVVLCGVLGITGWTGLARLLRGETLKLRELEFVQAAQAFGVRDARIMTRHVLPNVMHIVLISLAIDFSGLVLAEAVLSYVGVGVDPSMISFGTMINAARLEMSREPMVWWTLAAAFTFMFALVLAANLFSDAVRDAFDPRTRVGGLLPV
ncbi:MAG TPA: ABC transporter permease [Burkholderiales bacterium]|nr:ABC transporter permease [Burkholderiales bacterium]